MADLRERPPGRAPWIPAPDPWWIWVVRAAMLLLIAAAATGVPLQLLAL